MSQQPLRYYQQDAVNGVNAEWGNGKKDVILVMPTGCHAKDSEILMYNGDVIKVQDVLPGDLLMGPDSLPRTVLALARGREEMFQITPVKGSPFRVNKNHILHLIHTESKEEIDISVIDYLQKSNYFKHCHKLLRTGVDFEYRKPPALDPWFAGVMIGDGSYKSGTPCLTNADQNILERAAFYTSLFGCVYKDVKGSNCVTRYFSHPLSRRSVSNPLSDAMKSDGLWGKIDYQKFIPDVYKKGSKDTRLKILAGLIDSDGYVSHKGVDFVSKSPQLAADLVFVARSLGKAAYYRACVKSCQTGNANIYYRVCISGDLSDVPLVRKHGDLTRKQKKNHLVTGFSVRAVGEDDFYGFMINGDHLYLTSDFIVHHNSGKTRTMAELVKVDGVKVIQAHRKELVSQIAMAVAAQGLPHRFIAQKDAVKFATSQQMKKLGYSTYAPGADIVIASAPTLRTKSYERWHDSVTRVFSDEAHHLVKGTMWGTCRELFPNALGLGVTATPIRADGKGLGRHASGYADAMVIGPSMRDLINQHHLADYRLIMAETDIDLTADMISSTTGDYKPSALKKAMEDSNIVGDTVSTWKTYADGMLTVVFTVDVDSAEALAQEFRDAGVPAEAISSRNSDQERADILERFERRKTLIMCNADLFGEGFDCPAMECAVMDRPTESYSLFVQQMGRPLRYVPGKKALIIDKVGNVRRFIARGFPLPDQHYNWSLDDRDRRSSSSGSSNTTCTNKGDPDNGIEPCLKPYPAGLVCCPYCGHIPEKAERSGPDRVEGNLRELTAEELEELRRAVVIIDRDPTAVKEQMLNAGAPAVAAYSAMKNIQAMNDAQRKLRSMITTWAGLQRDKGVSDDSAYKMFYQVFGVDVLSAQALRAREANELAARVASSLI
ncbi:TPA: Hint domain-containing homing endonuclease [Salmonella enterica subsp. enterica serovar Javiana]